MTIPVHVSAEATPLERGINFGRAQAEAVGHSVEAYRKLFAASRGLTLADVRALGAECRAALVAGHPDLAIEIEAIADGAGQRPEELFALNARTEILAGSFKECSILGYSAGPGDQNAWIAQNWDWHPDARPARVLWEVHPASGLSFSTVTEAGILAKLGMNSAGLGVLLNLLATDGDGGTDGVPVHVALRLVLSRCRDVGEARALIEGLRFRASSAFSLIDLDGGLETLEVWPGGVNALGPDPDGFLTHANHFCASVSPARDVIVEQYPDSRERQGYLAREAARLETRPEPVAAERLLRSHHGGPISVCCHDADNPAYLERQESLLSLILRPGARTMLLTDGPPCQNEYRPHPVLTQSVSSSR